MTRSRTRAQGKQHRRRACCGTEQQLYSYALHHITLSVPWHHRVLDLPAPGCQASHAAAPTVRSYAACAPLSGSAPSAGR
eukprot:3398851-Rhodomonas_salina.2